MGAVFGQRGLLSQSGPPVAANVSVQAYQDPHALYRFQRIRLRAEAWEKWTGRRAGRVLRPARRPRSGWCRCCSHSSPRIGAWILACASSLVSAITDTVLPELLVSTDRASFLGMGGVGSPRASWSRDVPAVGVRAEPDRHHGPTVKVDRLAQGPRPAAARVPTPREPPIVASPVRRVPVAGPAKPARHWVCSGCGMRPVWAKWGAPSGRGDAVVGVVVVHRGYCLASHSMPDGAPCAASSYRWDRATGMGNECGAAEGNPGSAWTP